MKDPIVEEIRVARMKHAKKFKFDLHAICNDLRTKEMKMDVSTTSLKPKIFLKKTGT